MIAASFEKLLSLDLTMGGAAHTLRLRMPLWSETQSAILKPELRVPERLAAQLPVRIYDLVAEDGGTGRPRLASVKQWLADPQVAATLVNRHRAMVEIAREAGKVYLGCPACDGEVDLTLTAVALAVASALPPIFDGPFFAFPVLAGWHPRPARAPVSRMCRHLRFQLPSHELGLAAPFTEGFLGELDATLQGPREAAVFERWQATEDVDPYSPRSTWTFASPGFRESVRLTVALDDPRNHEVTPETIAALPICDVFFLDALYWLVYLATPRELRLFPCPRCGTEVAPVR